MRLFRRVVLVYLSLCSLKALAIEPQSRLPTTIFGGVAMFPFSGFYTEIEQAIQKDLSATVGFLNGTGRVMVDDIESEEISVGLKRKFDSFYLSGRLAHRSTNNLIKYEDRNGAPFIHSEKEKSKEVDIDFALGHQWTSGSLSLDCEWVGVGISLAGRRESKVFKNDIRSEEEITDLSWKGFPILLKIGVGYIF